MGRREVSVVAAEGVTTAGGMMNGTGNRRILLIDDAPAIHDDFRKILVDDDSRGDLDDLEKALFKSVPMPARLRFQLDSAFQGEEGLAKVVAALEEDQPYAMAFVDMRMPPGWDGVETIAHLWEADPRLQVVICTAYSDYSWDEVLQRLDVCDRLLVLKKPFDTVEVLQLASSLTAKWDMTRQAETKLATLEDAVRRRTLELAKAYEALQADMVRRQQAEQETRDAYRRISDILEFLPDATFVIDDAGKVIAWNRAIEVMTGVRKEEMLGEGDHAYTLPFYGTRKKALIDMLDEGAEVGEQLYPGVRREGKTLVAEARVMIQGEPRWLWSSATPLYNMQGIKVGGIQSLRDITEFKRSEQERSRLEAQLHHASLMEVLMSQLGHDLKTPLTPLFALLPLVRKKTSDSEIDRMLEICQISASQIQSLSSKALEMIRLSCSVTALEPAPVQLSAVADGCISQCRSLFSKRGISCVNGIGADLVVLGATEQLGLLLDNLFSNAARFAADNGRVEITARVEGDAAVVSVRDDGIGLMPGQGLQIFDEFFKADQARHDLNTQGLGLAICKRIVMNHKGRIWAESAGEGKGTTISFTLPLRRSDAIREVRKQHE
jgi:PAS domain S-box-containing protein